MAWESTLINLGNSLTAGRQRYVTADKLVRFGDQENGQNLVTTGEFYPIIQPIRNQNATQKWIVVQKKPVCKNLVSLAK